MRKFWEQVFYRLPRWLLLNLFSPNVSILYHLESPDNQRIFGVFRWYKMGTLARNGLNILKMLIAEFIFTNIDTFQSLDFPIFVMLCAIWYHLHNLKNVKNTDGRVFLLAKLDASACNFTKSITPPCVLFTFFKLCKLYQITQIVAFVEMFFSKYF